MAPHKKALITGVNGQDGSYLAELLLTKKNYIIYGGINQQSGKIHNILHIKDRLQLFDYNSEDAESLATLIRNIQPDEIYHLASSSFVSNDPDLESQIILNNTQSTFNIIQAIKNFKPKCRFFLAGSSEMFGNSNQSPQNENSLFNPQNIYGISKLKAYKILQEFRNKFNLFLCCGFLYNHESPRRNSIFLTRKITQAVAKIHLGLQQKIELGDIEAYRDFGHAKDYVEAMWLMLQNDLPTDYVISSGQTHQVKEVLQIACEYLGLNYLDHLVINPHFIRPSSLIQLVGDNSKIKRELNWHPRHSITQIIYEMIENDIVMIKSTNKIKTI